MCFKLMSTRAGHVEPLITAAAKSANIEKLLMQRLRMYTILLYYQTYQTN